MTRKTTVRFTMTIERFESIYPSSGPFPAARRVVNTTAETVEELPPRPLASARGARVIPFTARKAG